MLGLYWSGSSEFQTAQSFVDNFFYAFKVPNKDTGKCKSLGVVHVQNFPNWDLGVTVLGVEMWVNLERLDFLGEDEVIGGGKNSYGPDYFQPWE